ncbi:MAG TPA: RidA family protein [Kofleriaceae bacterium]|nr:RidA family protein [Kofleriaceae bacterium]
MKHQTLNPSALAAPRGYSHIAIVPAGRQVHVSGQVAMNASSEIVGPGDLEAQAEQVFTNLAHALAGAGAGLASMFKIVVYVVGLTPDKATTVRNVRNKHLGNGPFPASTMVGVTALVHPDLLIEIEAIATID